MIRSINDDKRNYWIDKNGNRWEKIKYSKKEAKIYSKTLIECRDCTDCICCSGCNDCYYCVHCNDCIDCYFCWYLNRSFCESWKCNPKT